MTATKPAHQADAVCHHKVGDMVVTAMVDGYLDGSFDLVIGVDKAEAAAAQKASSRSDPPRLTINTYLIWGGPKLILVDTGVGGGFGAGGGHLMGGLKAAGVSPADIGVILMTHAHLDHWGGMTVDGKAVFPNAEVVMSEAEFAFWLADDALAKAPEAMKDGVKGAQAALAPYRSRIRTVTGGEVAPGVTLAPLPGHTPGHSGFRVESGGQSLLIWGDVVHLPGIQFALPKAGVMFDADPAHAVATREKIFAAAASEGFVVCGMHMEFPGFGRVAREGDHYRFTPESWVSNMS